MVDEVFGSELLTVDIRIVATPRFARNSTAFGLVMIIVRDTVQKQHRPMIPFDVLRQSGCVTRGILEDRRNSLTTIC